MLAARPHNRVLLPPMASARRPAGASLQSLSGESMGTTWTVKTAAPAVRLAGLEQEVRRVLDEVVGQMSPWAADSTLSRFNRASAGDWIPIEPAFREVLACALRVAEATDGAFDPTLGALTDLWGFGPTPRTRLAPSSGEVVMALAAAGWRRVRLEGARLFQPGGLTLDLCGVAKGYAVDRVAGLLAEAGVPAWLVEIGGELRGAGLKPNGEPWWVELEAPVPAPGAVRTLLALHEVAVATSGGYRRFFDHAGRRFTHTLDPRLGAPLDDAMASVSVIHASCMEADALATALTVMGLEAAADYCERRGVAALIRSAPRGGAGPVEQLSRAMQAMM